MPVVELYPPKPEMEPPLYEPLEDAPDYALRVFKLDVMQSGFTPAEIVVNKGERVKLLVTALDFDHDIRISDFGIAEQLPKMQEAEIIFTADKPGEFSYECVLYCDAGAAGKIRVV